MKDKGFTVRTHDVARLLAAKPKAKDLAVPARLLDAWHCAPLPQELFANVASAKFTLEPCLGPHVAVLATVHCV